MYFETKPANHFIEVLKTTIGREKKKIAYSNQFEMNISDTKKYKILIKK